MTDINKGSVTIDHMIKSERELAVYLEHLHKRGIKEICLDLEGDQGSFRYAYSISILQIFDGEQSAIVDVLKVGNIKVLRDLLTCKDIVKIMFACNNDIFMTQNVLGCTISPVRDIAAGQKILGIPINLSHYINMEKSQKDSFQRANWLRRPIHPELLRYAINDVLLLFKIENEIGSQLEKLGLYDRYIAESQAPGMKNYIINQQRQYSAKFPGYSRLQPEQKRLAATVWIFRELLGEHFNSPVGYLLSKKAMKLLIQQPDRVVASLEQELNRHRRAEKRISRAFIEKLYNEALRSDNLPG